ncbi:fumarylacetoacetate hydrolase family protein [Pseudoroseicyclus tamaricis]|uniref:Fumarylacetoacetate hydrolase family protein n=1 Tax=Pseudoroseicyclus tamaricis TaxID=2705421 RepID=A0A6B2JHF9_9RHOB|nr:fumarylacetoacetate hydrolase family protein [Pseudoroseicyclus tamaricis]NDV00721.1 fumarylacetoacetate hydrolase family protein [Pseudoroseicyclus tamaricis]
MAFVFEPPAQPSLAIENVGERFPVRRIFCVGRNYAAHAAEMGSEVDREAPFYFTKSAHALLPEGEDLPYPPGTKDLHHEVELVVALGEGGAIFGHAVGLDMTRRDLQDAAKAARRPWATGKDFEGSAIIGAITPGPLEGDRIALKVNGETRQEGPLELMVWDVPSLMDHLATLYTLQAGDLIMTGTPAGVGPVGPGDVLEAEVPGLAPLRVTIATGSSGRMT